MHPSCILCFLTPRGCLRVWREAQIDLAWIAQNFDQAPATPSAITKRRHAALRPLRFRVFPTSSARPRVGRMKATGLDGVLALWAAWTADQLISLRAWLREINSQLPVEGQAANRCPRWRSSNASPPESQFLARRAACSDGAAADSTASPEPSAETFPKLIRVTKQTPHGPPFGYRVSQSGQEGAVARHSCDFSHLLDCVQFRWFRHIQYIGYS